MKRSLLHTFIALFVLSFTGRASAAALTPQQQLYEVSVLVDQDHLADAISLDDTLIQSGTLNGADLARAWNFLGLADEYAGQWMKSRHAFEEAAQLFGNHSEYMDDLAKVLNNMLTLYGDMGQPDEARKIGQRALQLFEQSRDHAGVAKAYNNLTSVELGQLHLRESRKYIQQAFAEMKLAGRLDDDELAAMYSNRASVDMKSGDPAAALSGFQHALKLWIGRFGEEHPRTGVGYVLLGNADTAVRNNDLALSEVQHGIAILDRTLGPKNPTTLQAQFALARALEANGDRPTAILTRFTANQALRDIAGSQCSGCTITAEAFR
jgi:tetratricopeptide (TPR) repeat protein